MKSRSKRSGFLRVTTDRRGVVAIMTGLLALPMGLAVGISIDYAQMAQGETALQDAVDNAALAGATVYGAASQSPSAMAVASNYFTNAPLPSTMKVSSPTVTTAVGTTNLGGTSNNVTVTATATVTPPFMALINQSFTMSATATASNPVVALKLSAGTFASNAGDWNAIWMYAVPMVDGKPAYGTIPAASTFYEIGSNCTNGAARCTGQTGWTVPTNQTLPTVTATQPIAFALENMTYGLGTSTATNGYGAPAGHTQWFYSALQEINQPPSQLANSSYTTTTTTPVTTTTYPYAFPFNFIPVTTTKNVTTTSTATTTYPTAASPAPQNCSLQVVKLTGTTVPTSAPISGSCFSDTDPTSGYPYAAMSCSAMNGSTYMFWWNDMGGLSNVNANGNGDDKDYNDAYYTISCTVGSGTNASSANTQVVLTR